MDYYYMPVSAPCRGPMLTAAALGLDLNLKKLDLFSGEHRKPEFLAINPQHVVPTLVDGDFTLWESRAISAYLVNKYGKDDSLYPKDPKTRAMIDRLLYFDMGTLYDRFAKWAYPKLFTGADLDPEKLKSVHEALGFLDGYLAGLDYAVGSTITIADHSLVVTVSTLKASGIDMSGYGNLLPWLERCEQNMPGFEVNKQGVEAWATMAYAKLNP